MKYTDRVYGKTTIDDSLALELMRSPTMKRIKGVDQAGYFEPWFPGISHSRFEHSVGVYLLLKKYNAPRVEQIAGLLHDVSHTAFSHCADYALASGSQKNQSHQDSIHDSFVKKSEIPAILKKYGIDVDEVLDDSKHPLKETNLPDLCADRIDYSLRTARLMDERSAAWVKKTLNNLKADHGKWVFSDTQNALEYAQFFHQINEKYFSGFASATMLKSVGDMLKHAIDKHIISEADLHKTDREVLAMVRKHKTNDPELQKYWKRMNHEIPAINDPNNFEAQVFCKSRMVDPWVKTPKGLKRLSELDSHWKKMMAESPAHKEYFLRFKK